MTKTELAAFIAQRTADYHKPVHTHAESRDQKKRLHRSLETRKKPAHVLQAEYEQQLEEARAGRYTPKPGEDIWLTESVGGGKLRFEVEE